MLEGNWRCGMMLSIWREMWHAVERIKRRMGDGMRDGCNERNDVSLNEV